MTIAFGRSAPAHVVDASAFLAFVQDEPGSQVVMDLLHRSLITSVNYGEVLTKLSERFHLSSRIIATAVERTGLAVATVDRLVASRFPEIRSIDRSARETLAGQRPLALADLCCLAFATELRLPVLTADRYWAELNRFGLEPEVVLIR